MNVSRLDSEANPIQAKIVTETFKRLNKHLHVLKLNLTLFNSAVLLTIDKQIIAN